jgi:hypothetical protein
LVQVIFTHNADGSRTIYIDGEVQASGMDTGSFANWNQDYALILANEASGDRPWLGEFQRVALFACALNSAEVEESFAAGPRPTPPPSIPATEEPEAAAPVAAITHNPTQPQPVEAKCW